VSDRIDTFDRFVECTILGDIVDDDQLEPATILCKFIVEEGALSERPDCAAYGVPCF
jgi:hypothetical protein